jgi:hypothetical protein
MGGKTQKSVLSPRFQLLFTPFNSKNPHFQPFSGSRQLWEKIKITKHRKPIPKPSRKKDSILDFFHETIKKGDAK